MSENHKRETSRSIAIGAAVAIVVVGQQPGFTGPSDSMSPAERLAYVRAAVAEGAVQLAPQSRGGAEAIRARIFEASPQTWDKAGDDGPKPP